MKMDASLNPERLGHGQNRLVKDAILSFTCSNAHHMNCRPAQSLGMDIHHF